MAAARGQRPVPNRITPSRLRLGLGGTLRGGSGSKRIVANQKQMEWY